MSNLRINIFTYGDSEDINTWSGLPYYFSNALAAQQIQIHRVNLIPSEYLQYRLFSRWKSCCARVQRKFGWRSRRDLFRTNTNYRLTDKRVRASLSRSRDVDLNLFLTFSFSSRPYSAIPAVHYCDRTYQHYLEECGHPAGRRDRMFIDIERRNLESADLVLTTNQGCTDFIGRHYDVTRVTTLPGGMNTDAIDFSVDGLLRQKARSTHLLCIGRGVYSRGVDILIRAFRIFNAEHHRHFTLHVVGVSHSELPLELQTETGEIQFYPYLDRSVPAQRDTYDELVRKARMFVLPMRPGPLPNVLQEVQFYCTPVIISGVADAVAGATAGYCVVDSFQPEHFARTMTDLVTDADKWRAHACGAHNSVKSCTWSRTAENFVEIVRACGIWGRRHSGIVGDQQFSLPPQQSGVSVCRSGTGGS